MYCVCTCILWMFVCVCVSAYIVNFRSCQEKIAKQRLPSLWETCRKHDDQSKTDDRSAKSCISKKITFVFCFFFDFISYTKYTDLYTIIVHWERKVGTKWQPLLPSTGCPIQVSFFYLQYKEQFGRQFKYSWIIKQSSLNFVVSPCTTQG